MQGEFEPPATGAGTQFAFETPLVLITRAQPSQRREFRALQWGFPNPDYCSR